MHPLVAILLTALALYLALGIVVALAFVTTGVTHVQHASVSLGARILLVPGAVVLWPCVLTRWIRAGRS